MNTTSSAFSSPQSLCHMIPLRILSVALFMSGAISHDSAISGSNSSCDGTIPGSVNCALKMPSNTWKSVPGPPTVPFASFSCSCTSGCSSGTPTTNSPSGCLDGAAVAAGAVVGATAGAGAAAAVVAAGAGAGAGASASGSDWLAHPKASRSAAPAIKASSRVILTLLTKSDIELLPPCSEPSYLP